MRPNWSGFESESDRVRLLYQFRSESFVDDRTPFSVPDQELVCGPVGPVEAFPIGLSVSFVRSWRIYIATPANRDLSSYGRLRWPSISRIRPPGEKTAIPNIGTAQ